MLHNCQNCSHWKLISKVRLTVIQIWLSVFLFLSLQINTLIHIPWQKLHLNFNSKLHIWMDGRRDGGRVGGRDGGLGGGLETHHDLFPWRKQSYHALQYFLPSSLCFAFMWLSQKGCIPGLFICLVLRSLHPRYCSQEDWGGVGRDEKSIFLHFKVGQGKRVSHWTSLLIFSLCKPYRGESGVLNMLGHLFSSIAT